MKKSIIISSIFCFIMLLISNTSYFWFRSTASIIFIGVGIFITLIVLNVYSIKKAFKKEINKSKFIPPILYTLTIVLTFIYPEGLIDYEQYQSEILLTAQSEGTASCGTTLTFRKDGKVEQKSFCFGSYYKTGYYKQNKNQFLIYGLNDTSHFDLAQLISHSDLIGQTYKKLKYYHLGDTLSNPLIYEAFDIDTECPDFDINLDSSEIDFLLTRMDTNNLILFEENKGSKLIDRDIISMGGSYYPLFVEYPVGNPIAFIRKFKGGIPLETLYYYSNDTLMVQYYEWSASGCKCLRDLTEDDFETKYLRIKEKIIEKKGDPIDIIKKDKQIKIIWDNSVEHLELHLYLYGRLRIRLINYWKSK